MKQLIVNADDFGLHELINEAIVESHVAGCVTSTSIMAGGEAFEHAVRLARKHPKLGVGVHLTLVGACPVARGDIHTLLTKEGAFFPSYGQFIKKYVSGKISRKHVEWELLCQMQRAAGTGIKITHIDSHQHLHALPGLAEVIGRVAREFNVNKIRIPAEPIGFLGKGVPDISRLMAKTVLTGCSLLAQSIYKRMGFFFPQHFFGMMVGGSMRQSSLLHILKGLPEGISEIMVHPGKNTQALEQLFPWGYHWQEEMEALKSKEVLESIKKCEIQLVNYNDIGNIDGRSINLVKQ
ncbi:MULTISPECIES: ChbG/HpnK family deacetylase [Pelosinus]|uniref:YdjC family protein n=1 Tax=Pelosinus fermentans B4 TaxID=1149862 RepID=I8RM24_9FIRM|nr:MULTISPECIES: ChbG/HpnK family deacetylase [Pelosinus]EIW19770.1 YdjC family protein [Pelosinus fermentans B4]EIW21373.1 YdjC family protein [Pelosinus fermentans A11]OAM94924.1 YdjC family protein [Pelosinus fermentans DSM 17108]SDR20454.1 hopanoid biosynthesis associated protein HpnK [Pelosinus fermentans]